MEGQEKGSGEEGWLELCRFDELPEDGTGLDGLVGTRQVAIFRVGPQAHVIDNVCPHAGASLSLGVLSDGEVTCPAHALHFDLCTGKSSDGQGERVRVWPARVDGDGWVRVATSRI